MGCTGSAMWSRSRQRVSSDKRESYDRRPKVSVRILSQVKKADAPPTVIFIFGGPGSRKGCIVDDLVTAYNLVHICTEEILFQELPKKLPDAKLDNVNDLKSLLEGDPSQVTLEWILEMIEERINSNLTAQYLIDFIPNLKYMIRAQFLQEDCQAALEKFEQKFPISFALNLAIPPDKVISSKQQTYITSGSKELSAMKESGGKGDEADTAKLQKRAAMYMQSSRNLIDYFTEKERLVTVDVRCGESQLIWHQVNHVLCQLNFYPLRTVNTALLFLFDETDFASFDCEKYQMGKINLLNLDNNPTSLESLLSALTLHLDKNSRRNDSFVINASGTLLAAEEALEKASFKGIVFMDIDEGYLETYLPCSPKNYTPLATSPKFRAVSSLENEVCLFPLGTSDEICTTIALHLANNRLH